MCNNCQWLCIIELLFDCSNSSLQAACSNSFFTVVIFHGFTQLLLLLQRTLLGRLGTLAGTFTELPSVNSMGI